MNKPTTEEQIEWECNKIKELLITKNRAYGDSALNPAGIFSKLSAVEAIKIRIDDKLKRIQNKGITPDVEDSVEDLLGYLILLKIAMKK